MSEAVKETICTNCMHKDVCCYKKSYLETAELLPNVNDIFNVTLFCRYYRKEIANPRLIK